jgi:ATP-dependent helicase HrpB
MTSLPVEAALPAIGDALASSRAAVLQAPPGAGKTTLVPLALRDADWLGDRRIVMLEPRRLATRAAAHRMAELLREPVGATVGYRMRGESRVGSRTRIEVVTEGILTRRIQHDPILADIGLLIFDEFHERSLDADLGLALALHTRTLVRDDLRILIMSATLDGESVAGLLDDAPIVSSEGRLYPIETRYLAPRPEARLEQTVANAVRTALGETTGDILVFLPGIGEIRRTEEALQAHDLRDSVVLPLHGSLPHHAQDRALRPDPEGRRKIVLSTAIAETSLTIEGVRVVIDAGLSRVPRFSPRTGMTGLETVRVSRASADQRRGRAGRLGPGICYRLWPEYENTHLIAATPPEITSADLAPLALELAAAGIDDPGELRWLDPPAPAPLAQARELLRELGALEASNALTPHGRAMSELPVHPRLAHMLLRAQRSRSGELACRLAALLSERDVFRGAPATIDADVTLRLDVLRARDPRDAYVPPGADVDRESVRRIRVEAERLMRQLDIRRESRSSDDSLGAGELLALAYPDRVAQRRDGSRARFTLRNGRGAELEGAQSLANASYLVAAELDDRKPDARILLAAPLTLDEVHALFGDQMTTDDDVELDDATSIVTARRRQRLGALVLRDVALSNPDPELVRTAVMQSVARRGVATLPWSDGARRLQQRMHFVATHLAEWPDLTDAALDATVGEWLAPALMEARRPTDLSSLDLAAVLLGRLDWKQRALLDELAPTHLEVPTGSRIPIDYSDPAAPSLAVRIQELFGLAESPRILGGRVTVTLQLLSPAHRPVQVTRDLAGFWANSYFDVRKDLRGRYPKHEWPDDPLHAEPTRRAKRRPS